MRRTHCLAMAALVLGPLALAACTSAKPVRSSPPSAASRVVTSSPQTPSASDTPTADPSAATASATPTTPAPGPVTAASPASGPACTTKSLRLDVLRGSGASGHQFALISLTNTGPAACLMSGAPAVTLMRGGAVLGTPAQPSAKAARALTLAPAKAATTTLTGFSTCNAMNSDTVRVTPPGQTAALDAPLVLRGCELEVDPVGTVAD